MLFTSNIVYTSIIGYTFTRVMMVRQLDNLSLWSNRVLLANYGVAVGLQLLALYTPLRNLFEVVALDWRAWVVMNPVVIVSSFTGVYMTRWILKLSPMRE